MSEAYRAILDRFGEEVFRQGNLDVIDELLAEDFVEHDPPPGLPPDRDGVKEIFRGLHAGFTDQVFTVHDQIAGGDRVVERWTLTATHAGEWLDIPPTGRRVTVAGIDISRLEAGRIVEHWSQADLLGLFEQLGAFPAVAPVGA